MKYFSIKELTVPSSYSLQDTGTTQSLHSVWKTCRRKYLFHINLWERIEEDRFAYHTMMHYLLEVLYKQSRPDTNLIKQEIRKYKLLGKLDQIEFLKATAEAMMEGYLRNYQKDFTEKRFEAVEGKFVVKFGQFLLLGKKDGRFRDKTGCRWHIEHKNYSRINEDFLLEHLSFDLQNMFYALADLLEFKKLLNGVLYNIIRKPETKKERTASELYTHLHQEILKRSEYYYIRYEVPYSKNEIDEFKESLMYQLNELNDVIIHCKTVRKDTLVYFYKNESACEGRYTCPFLSACSSGCLNGYRKRKHLFPELEG